MELEQVKACVPKFLSLLDHGLVSGKGKPFPGQMCVEAAWCNALGLPHSDNPPCVGSAVREAKIKLNDSNWSSNKARADGLRAIGLAQMGSDKVDQKKFSSLLMDSIPGLKERHGCAFDIESFCLAHAKRYLAQETEYGYTIAASYAIDGAREIAERSKHSDAVLLEFAGIILDALKKLESPGCEWLPMIEAQ